jgi:hypothetical protein
VHECAGLESSLHRKTQKGGSDARMDIVGERDFRERVSKAIEKARTVLALGTNPELPEVRREKKKACFPLPRHLTFPLCV